MDSFFHRFSELFAQLGLSRDPADIRAFIDAHSPLPTAVRLEDALFWSEAQAALLREKLLEDSDWAGVVEQLNLSLRSSRPLLVKGEIRVVCLCTAWCDVCREFVSRYKEAMGAMPNVAFGWYDVEDDVEMLGDIDVENFPCILVGVREEPVFFGPISPNRSTLERLVLNAPQLKPFSQNFPDRDRLGAILKLGRTMDHKR